MSGALIGFGFVNISSIGQSVAATLAAPHRMGLVTATFFIFFNIGKDLALLFLVWSFQQQGFKALYAILGIIVFAMSALYYFLQGKKECVHRFRMDESS